MVFVVAADVTCENFLEKKWSVKSGQTLGLALFSALPVLLLLLDMNLYSVSYCGLKSTIEFGYLIKAEVSCTKGNEASLQSQL